MHEIYFNKSVVRIKTLLDRRRLLYLSVLLITYGAQSANQEHFCPECCTCNLDQNEAIVSCDCLPKIIPHKTTQFVLKTDEDTFLPFFNFTHPTWQNLNSFSWFGGANSKTIPSNTFHGLSNLEVLRINNYHDLHYIPTGTLRHLRKLKVLDLSKNYELDLKGLSSLIPDLQVMSVEVLNVSWTNRYDGGYTPTVLDKQFISKTGNLSLKVVDISWTRGIILDFHGARLSDFPIYVNIETLNISYVFFMLSLMDGFNLENLTIFPALRRLVVEGLSIVVPAQQAKRTCTRETMLLKPDLICSDPEEEKVILPPLLEVIDFDNFGALKDKCAQAIRIYCVDTNNKLKSVSLKNWGLTGLSIELWGLKELSTLDLRYNRLAFISDVNFKNFPKLKRLLLGSNSLWKFQNDPMFERMLLSCSELREIDLSANGLSGIPRMLFSKNILLENIDLSNNRLSSISFTMGHLLNLQILNLSRNILSELPETAVRDIYKISKVYSLPFIDLTNNNMTCSCVTKTFVKVLHDISDRLVNFKTYNCLYEGNVVKIHSIDDTTLSNDCIVEILTYALPVTCVCIFLIILMIIIYRKRVYLTKLSVTCRFWRYRKKVVDTEDRVFLAYSHKDKVLVLSRIYPDLNSKLQQLLQRNDDVVYINDKDFALPGLIDEEITTAVSSCKCTIALVSRHFLQSSFAHLEVSYSWLKKRPIILVLLDDIHKNELRGVLRYCYDKNVRLVWPRNNNEEDIFWPNLLRGIIKTFNLRREKQLLEQSMEITSAAEEVCDYNAATGSESTDIKTENHYQQKLLTDVYDT